MNGPAEAARAVEDARRDVVQLARTLVSTDRDNRSFATVMLRDAVAQLDAAEAAVREAQKGQRESQHESEKEKVSG